MVRLLLFFSNLAFPQRYLYTSLALMLNVIPHPCTHAHTRAGLETALPLFISFCHVDCSVGLRLGRSCNRVSGDKETPTSPLRTASERVQGLPGSFSDYRELWSAADEETSELKPQQTLLKSSAQSLKQLKTMQTLFFNVFKAH